MDQERSDSSEKVLQDQEVMLPGFRFHPTDEELVGFYLKRKIQQRPLSIELIKQLDIYKHDPWDLPKLGSTAGEKEWYFYCPRDRKYRNSARPNRVTGAGFWKATGTDRPIYSSDGTNCIGLKKSLVFYKGRASKGFKTDWMMHEFRLPSLADNNINHSLPSKRSSSSFHTTCFPANDSWAICRIFKKTNSTAQRGLSHSWVSPNLAEPIESTSTDQYMLPKGTTNNINSCQFSSETSNVSQSLLMSTTKTTSLSSPIRFCSTTNDSTIQDSPTNRTTSFSPVDFSSLYKAYHNNPMINSISSADFCPSLLFPPLESTGINTNTMLLNMSSILGDSHFGCNKSLISDLSQNHEEQHGNNNDGFEIALPYHHDLVFQGSNNLGNISSAFDHQNFTIIKNLISVNEGSSDHQIISDQDQWETIRSSLGFHAIGTALPLPDLPLNTSMVDHPWKPSLLWDTSQCPTQVMSTNFPTTRCYT